MAAETPRAIAPVFATDSFADPAHPDAADDGKVDATSATPAAFAASPAAPASPTVAQVAAPVGSPEFASQLGDRLAVLVNQNLTSAKIQLSPAHLGPLEIRIAISDGQASVAITTHSQATCDALEAAAPKLRETLGAQGFGSVSVDVSQQQFRERSPQSSRYDAESPVADLAPAPAASGADRVRATNSALRLDAYA
jgi:flagellar hook-length control protein FliK